MAVSALTAALSGASQLLPVQAAAGQRLNVAVCSAAVASASGSGVLSLATDRCAVEAASSPLTGSLSCSPPRAGTANHMRRALTPSHCLAPGKTRRRRRPSGGGDDLGDGGDDGGSYGGGSGGGDWFGGWDGSESPDEALAEGFWFWQVLCVISLIQAFLFLLENSKTPQPHSVQAASFATLSQTFYSRRLFAKGSA